MANAKTEGQTAGNIGYTAWQRNTEVADDGIVTVNHDMKDTGRKRIVSVWNMATGALIAPGAATVSVTATDDDTTTVVNLSGGTLDLMVGIFIPS